MKSHSRRNTSGFIALTSIIFISVILESFLIVSSFKSLDIQEQLRLTQAKEQSYYQAISCIESSRLLLAHKNSYDFTKEIALSEFACTTSISKLENGKTKIETKAESYPRSTSIEAYIDTTNYSIIYLREI